MNKKSLKSQIAIFIKSQPLIIIALIILAIILRIALFKFTSSDLEIFLKEWFNYYDEVSLKEALQNPISNYTGPYNYLLFAANIIQNLLENQFHLFVSDISMIKLINLPFEGLAIVSSVSIVNFYRKDQRSLFLAFGLVLFYPILLLNSSFWGQCDIIYTSFLLASFTCFLYRRPVFSVILFGVAFSFKFQAMFFAPFLLAAVLQKRINWSALSLIPITYCFMHIPSLVAGRGFFDILSIYFQQAGSMPVLTANAPNIYQVVVWDKPKVLTIVKYLGVVVSVVIGLVYAVKMQKSERNSLNSFDLATVSLSLMLMPYFLPSMLDRYFFAAELFLLLLAIVEHRFWFLPVLTGLASLGAYYNSYNIMSLPLNSWPVKVGAVFNGIVMLVLLWKIGKFKKDEFQV